MSLIYPSITLQISGISVSLWRFLEEPYPRIEANDPENEVEYSVAGSIAVSGWSYEPRHIWSINCVMEHDEWDALEAIYLESDRLRRANSPNFDVLILDTTADFKEPVPRTRAIVGGTSERLILGGAYVKYYAQFLGYIVARPKRVKLGKYLSVTAQIVETQKIPPT